MQLLFFGWETIALDINKYRVSNRSMLAIGKSVEKVKEKHLKVVPAEFKVDVHQWFILYSRYTSIARKPK